MFAPLAAADFADHHLAGVDPDPDRQATAPLEMGAIQVLHPDEDLEPGADRALGIVFVGAGVAEIDQHSVAQILGDESFEAPDRRGRFVLILAQDVAQVFGVELRGKLRRADEVAEHDRELAALGACHRGRHRGDHRRAVLRFVTPRCVGRLGHGCGIDCGTDLRLAALPDEHPALVVERKLQHLDNLGFQVIDECVIDPELALERAIRHPLLPAEHLDRLDQALLERHAVPGYSRSICVPQDTSAGTKSNRGKQCRRPAD